MLENKAHWLFYSIFSALPMIIGSALMGPFVFSSFFMGGVLLFFFSCLWGFSGLFVSMIAYAFLVFGTDFALIKKTEPLVFLGISLMSSFLVAALTKRIEEKDEVIRKERIRLEESVIKLKEDLFSLNKQMESFEKKGDKDLQEFVENAPSLAKTVLRRKKGKEDKGQVFFQF